MDLIYFSNSPDSLGCTNYMYQSHLGKSYRYTDLKEDLNYNVGQGSPSCKMTLCTGTFFVAVYHTHETHPQKEVRTRSPPALFVE